MNLKSSGVSASSRNAERVLFPGSNDVTWDLAELIASLKEGEEIELAVLDFADAFFQVPVTDNEMPFLTAKYRNKYYVFLRAAQGSRGAPLLWARLAALVSRLTSALSSTSLVRTSIYVDDPVIAATGVPSAIKRALAKIMCSWMALGLRLAFAKASHAEINQRLTWTSSVFRGSREVVTTSVKDSIVEEVRAVTSVKDSIIDVANDWPSDLNMSSIVLDSESADVVPSTHTYASYT